MKPELTQSRLREVIDYDPDTGEMLWLTGQRAGYVAGSPHPRGYVTITISQKHYLAHRLAWLYVHGEWPPHQLDHINGIKSDNRLSNLRSATPTDNQANRRGYGRGPFKGAYLLPYGKWTAQLRRHGKNHYLGVHDTAEEAHAAYCEAAERLHGEFANGGSK